MPKLLILTLSVKEQSHLFVIIFSIILIFSGNSYASQALGYNYSKLYLSASIIIIRVRGS